MSTCSPCIAAFLCGYIRHWNFSVLFSYSWIFPWEKCTVCFPILESTEKSPWSMQQNPHFLNYEARATEKPVCSINFIAIHTNTVQSQLPYVRHLCNTLDILKTSLQLGTKPNTVLRTLQEHNTDVQREGDFYATFACLLDKKHTKTSMKIPVEPNNIIQSTDNIDHIPSLFSLFLSLGHSLCVNLTLFT